MPILGVLVVISTAQQHGSQLTVMTMRTGRVAMMIILSRHNGDDDEYENIAFV